MSESLSYERTDWNTTQNEIGSGDTSRIDALESKAVFNQVNVKDYGAVGDGLTDDTASIQSLLVSNAKLFFPYGTYLITGLTMTSLSNIELVAEKGTTIKLADSADDYGLNINGCSNINIIDLNFNGNQANQTDTGASGYHTVYFENSDGCTVDGCNFTNSASSSVRARNCSRFTIKNCYITTATYIPIYIGPADTGGEIVSHIRVLNNIVDWSTVANTVNNMSALSVVTNDATKTISDVVVSGNTVYQADSPASEYCTCINLRTCSRFVISNNTTKGGGLGISTTTDCDNGSITNNTLEYNHSKYAIELAGGQTRVSVVGNTVYDTGGNGNGIQLNASSSYISISGNTIHGSVNGIKVIGSAVGTPSYQISITGNSINSSDDPIYLQYVDILNVTGNTGDANDGGQGLVLNMCDRFTVTGNTFIGLEYFGVQLYSASAHTISNGVISGNTFELLGNVLNYVKNSLTSGTVTNLRVHGNSYGYNYRDYGNNIIDAHGAGTPESSIAAGIGSTYLRSNGGESTTLYIKESGTGNTGWIAK